MSASNCLIVMYWRCVWTADGAVMHGHSSPCCRCVLTTVPSDTMDEHSKGDISRTADGKGKTYKSKLVCKYNRTQIRSATGNTLNMRNYLKKKSSRHRFKPVFCAGQLQFSEISAHNRANYLCCSRPNSTLIAHCYQLSTKKQKPKWYRASKKPS